MRWVKRAETRLYRQDPLGMSWRTCLDHPTSGTHLPVICLTKRSSLTVGSRDCLSSQNYHDKIQTLIWKRSDGAWMWITGGFWRHEMKSARQDNERRVCGWPHSWNKRKTGGRSSNKWRWRVRVLDLEKIGWSLEGSKTDLKKLCCILWTDESIFFETWWFRCYGIEIKGQFESIKILEEAMLACDDEAPLKLVPQQDDRP